MSHGILFGSILFFLYLFNGIEARAKTKEQRLDQLPQRNKRQGYWNNQYEPWQYQNHYPNQYYNWRPDYRPNTYEQHASNHYYHPYSSSYYSTPSPVTTPGGILNSLISRYDGPIKSAILGYDSPNNYYDGNRPIRKKKKLFVPNLWG